MVQARERQADGDRSLVVGRGRIDWTMLSLIALAWQKLAWSWQAASQPASHVGHVVPTTAFLVGTAVPARHSDFFCCEQKMGVQETTCKNKILFHIASTYVIKNFPSMDVFEKRVRMDKSPIV